MCAPRTNHSAPLVQRVSGWIVLALAGVRWSWTSYSSWSFCQTWTSRAEIANDTIKNTVYPKLFQSFMVLGKLCWCLCDQSRQWGNIFSAATRAASVCSPRVRQRSAVAAERLQGQQSSEAISPYFSYIMSNHVHNFRFISLISCLDPSNWSRYLVDLGRQCFSSRLMASALMKPVPKHRRGLCSSWRTFSKDPASVAIDRFDRQLWVENSTKEFESEIVMCSGLQFRLSLTGLGGCFSTCRMYH